MRWWTTLSICWQHCQCRRLGMTNNDTPPVAAKSAAPLALWLVLLAAAGAFALPMGTRQTMGLFLSALNTSTALGIGSISLAFAFGQLWWGLTQPFAGAVADRIGTGRVILLGVALVALGTFITPYMTTTAGLIFAIGVLAAGGAGMAGPSVLMAATARLVPASKRGLASGIVNAGGSFGQFVMAPIAISLTAAVGWASAMQWLGVLVLLALPAVWVLKGNSNALAAQAAAASGQKALTARAATGPAPATPSYRYLAVGFLVCGFHVAFLAALLPGVIAACGLAPEVGGWALAHEVIAVAAVRHAGPGGAGLLVRAQDTHGGADLRRRDGCDVLLHRAAHRWAGGQDVRHGQHGHAVRHRDAFAPGWRLFWRLPGRQRVPGHGQL